jgi:piezo-type mechanosensitive ion channel component 1/2
MWANVIWIIPNQRKNMLLSSPFLVVYSECMLLATYLFGMDLTDDELPQRINVNGISLIQIGFIKYPHYPIGPIIVKSLFNVVFLSSLRQMLQERATERQSTAFADMVAPLQLTVGAATTREGIHKKEEKKPEFIEKIGRLIDAILVKIWIFLVVFVLYGCAITGNKMTGFRIIYMTLFLVFVMTFQFSYARWRRFLYGYWVVVIVWSILILISVYTYQFEKTDELIANWLFIDVEL